MSEIEAKLEHHLVSQEPEPHGQLHASFQPIRALQDQPRATPGITDSGNLWDEVAFAEAPPARIHRAPLCGRAPTATINAASAELALIAAAYTLHAPERADQRVRLTRTSNAIETVARDLHRQAEAPMLKGLQDDPARIAYLTLALNLVELADSMEECVRSLTIVEEAMREVKEEHERVSAFEISPAQRSLLAMGEPIAIANSPLPVSPAQAKASWDLDLLNRQEVSARAALDRFEQQLLQAGSVLRDFEVPVFDGPTPLPQAPAPHGGAGDPSMPNKSTVEGAETLPGEIAATGPQEDPNAGQPAMADAAPSGAGAGAGAAAAGGAAAAAGGRRFGGVSRGSGGGAAATEKPAWVSRRALHDTGPDSSMDPAAAPVPATGAGHGATGGEEESGTALATSSHEEEAAATGLALSALTVAGSRSAITPAVVTDSKEW